MRDKLQEILEHEFKRNTIRGTERVDKENFMTEVIPKLLDLLDKSVASVELADTYDIEGGEDPYDAYEMGFDRGVADVRKVIKED